MRHICIILFTALLATQAWAATTFTVGYLKYTVVEGTTNVSVSRGSTPTEALDIPEKVTNPNNEQEYTVTSIGESAFENCTGLKSVTIGSSVTSIGIYAFSGCSGLTSVTIPNSVKTIGESAFENCEGLTSVTIPNSVKTIGESAFENCEGLTSVTIPNSVTSIGSEAFYECTGLTSVTIPNSVKSIGKAAFSYCNSLEKAEFASIESLCGIDFGNWAANPLCEANHLYITGEENEVTELTIPSSVTSIGDYAFTDCSGLTSVTIPNTVTSIGEQAFYNCSGLTSVTIPNSVTSIGSEAFYECTGLTSVTIGNSVTSIGSEAFRGCSGLTSVTIGNSVTSIGNYAFDGCSGLTSVNIPNSVTSIGYDAFYGCSKAILYCETEESAILEKWNAYWNKSGGTVKWGCKVIRAEADNNENGSVTIGGENNAAIGANGSLWYLNETTNGTATLTAAPTEGYHFVKWTSEGVEDITENPVTLDVTAGRTYTAVFELGAPTSVKSDEQSQINIFAVGKNIIVENADSEIFVTDMAGREIAREMPVRHNVISVAASGIYVVKVGKTVKRLLVK